MALWWISFDWITYTSTFLLSYFVRGKTPRGHWNLYKGRNTWATPSRWARLRSHRRLLSEDHPFPANSTQCSPGPQELVQTSHKRQIGLIRRSRSVWGEHDWVVRVNSLARFTRVLNAHNLEQAGPWSARWSRSLALKITTTCVRACVSFPKSVKDRWRQAKEPSLIYPNTNRPGYSAITITRYFTKTFTNF